MKIKTYSIKTRALLFFILLFSLMSLANFSLDYYIRIYEISQIERQLNHNHNIIKKELSYLIKERVVLLEMLQRNFTSLFIMPPHIIENYIEKSIERYPIYTLISWQSFNLRGDIVRPVAIIAPNNNLNNNLTTKELKFFRNDLNNVYKKDILSKENHSNIIFQIRKLGPNYYLYIHTYSINLKDETRLIITGIIKLDDLLSNLTEILVQKDTSLIVFEDYSLKKEIARLNYITTENKYSYSDIFLYDKLKLYIETYINLDKHKTYPHNTITIIVSFFSMLLSISLAYLWHEKYQLNQSQYLLLKKTEDLEKIAHKNTEIINELENSNNKLSIVNNKLNLLNKELDDFTHVVSHDLKEPLRGIQAFSQFLIEDYKDKLDSMGLSYLDNLKISSLKLQRLINDLMQLARIGKSVKNFKEIFMADICDRAIQALDFIIKEKNAEIIYDKSLPLIYVDPIQIELVLKNLISNSIKYNDKNYPIIKISCIEHNDSFEFIFEDNGIGIDKRFYEKIFGLFERLATEQSYEGTGAGLAICKKIVENHGGRIWVESVLKSNTQFHFTILKLEYMKIFKQSEL